MGKNSLYLPVQGDIMVRFHTESRQKINRNSSAKSFVNKLLGLFASASVFASVLTTDVLAQQPSENVGIGTKNPDPSALLDLSTTLLSSPKGFLVPRMTRAERINIQFPATGLLVWQSEGDDFGFWYFNGKTWQPLQSLNFNFLNPQDGSTSQLDSLAWLIRGNKTTDPNKHFMGTINPVDLIFKTGNLERLRLTSQGDVNVQSLTTGGMVKALPGTGTLVIATPGANGDYELPLSFNNGITRSGQSVSLGGALTQNTEIDLGNLNLTFPGTGKFGIGTSTPTASFEVAGTPGVPNVRMGSLSGVGQRIVGADASGALTTIDFAGGSVVGGSGTVNFLPKWTPNSTTLGNSQLFDDGTNIGVGTTTPVEFFSIGNNSQFQVNRNGALVAATGITSSGAVTFSGLSAGGVLKAIPGTGTLALATPGTDFENILTFSNGLTRTGDNVELGGNLTKATSINIGTNDLTISAAGNTGNVIIGKFAQAGVVKNLDGGALVSGKVDLVNDVTGILSPNNGGTGRNSVGLPGTVAYSNGTILDFTAQGTNGQVLISNGTNAPTWVNASTLYTFENGLTANGNVVGLGGTLNKTTELNVGNNSLILSSAGNTGNIVIGKFTTAGIVKNDAAGVLSSGKVDLLNDVTGTLTPANGGTGNTVVGGAGTVAFSDGTRITYTGVGTPGQVLISDGSGDPKWTKTLSEFTINQSTFNSPIIAGSTTVLGDITFNGPAVFNDTAIFNKTPKFPLNRNYIFVGNTQNLATPFAPGANGSILSINPSGDVQWTNNLPSTIDVPFNQVKTGINTGQALTVGAGSVLEGSNGGIVRANEFVGTGSTTSAVDLNTAEVNGILSPANGGTGSNSVGQAGTVAYSDGTKLTYNNVGVDGQVLISKGSGTPEWTNALTGLTLNNTTLNGGTTINNNLEVNGPLQVDSSAVFNGTTTFNGPVNFNQLPNLPLPLNNIYVGNSQGNAQPKAPINNSILTTDASGTVEWRNSLPTGISVPFDQVSSGTNTGQTLKVGAGTSLTMENGGIIAANQFLGSDSQTNAVDLNTSEVNGVLAPEKGGTGNTSVGQAGTVAYSDGTKLSYNNVGVDGQVLISKGAGTPEWTNSLTGLNITNTTISNSTVNNSTLNNITIDSTLTVNGPTNFNNSVTFNQTVIFDNPPELPLPQNNIYVGNAQGKAEAKAPINNSILTTDASGNVEWRNSLPAGTTVSFDQVTSGTNSGQALTVGAGTVLEATNGGINRANEFVGSGSTTNAVDLNTAEVNGVLSPTNGGTGNTAVGLAGTVAYSDGTKLNYNNVGVDGQVLISKGSGTPEWTNALTGLTINNSTVNNSTFNNITIDSTLIINGPTTFNNNVTFNQLPNLPLPLNNVYVGNAQGNAQAKAPINNSILTTDASGNVDWRNTLPPGTTVSFDQITSGTNSGQALTVGAGTVLEATNGGINRANEFVGTGSTTNAVDLNTAEVNGTLSPTNGGTGNTTVGLAGTVAYSDGSKIDYTTVGTNGQILISKGSNTPEWSSNIANVTIDNSVINNTTVNNSTLNNITVDSSLTVNGPTIFNDTVVFNTNVTFNQLPNLPLPLNNVYVGNAQGNAQAKAPINNSILTTDASGNVDWRNTLPPGTTVSFDQITSGTNSGQALTVGAGTVLEATNGGINRANEFVGTGSTTNAVDLNTTEVNGTLPIGNGGTGVTTVPTNGQLLIGNGTGYTVSNLTAGQGITITNSTGAITIATSTALDSGTVNNSTLRWDDTQKRWVENTNILSTSAGQLSVQAGVNLNGTSSPLLLNGSNGNNGQVLISKGANQTPQWSNVLTNITLDSSTTINGPTVFNDIVNFGDTVIFSIPPVMPLTKGSIYVGNNNNVAEQYAVGTDGQVLMVESGTPTWKNGLGIYKFQNGLTLTGDTVRLGGALTQNTTIPYNTFNLTFGQAGNSGTTGFETGVNLGSGTNTTVPFSTRGTAGNNGQVLISRGTGNSPEYVDTLNNFVLNSSTFNNSTLNNNTTVNGPTVFNNNVTVNDTAEFNNKVIFNQLPELPLPKGNIWVGNENDIADSVAPGANGTVLRIVNGIPTWTNSTSLYTFENGVNRSNDTVRLGGALTQNTTIPYSTFNLTFGQAGNSGTTGFETGVNLGSGTNTTVPLISRGTSGNNGQVLISRGTGNSPEYVDTLNNFVLNSSTFNNSTLNNNTTVNGPTVFNNNVTVNDTAEFNNKVIFNQLPELPLPKGNIWVGNENDIADSVAPGANGTVLRIVNGIPTWTNSTSLYTFLNGLTLTGDTVRFGGALTQNTTLGLGINNLTIGNSGQSGTTTFETGVNLGSGTNTTVPLSTRGTSGNNGQVLISRGAGNSPEYVDTLNNFVLNSSTFNNSTLNNNTTVNGPAIFNNTVNHNDNVTFGDTAIFNSKVLFNQLPQLPLPKGNIWVGDSTGYADSVAPGANGTVLRIVNGIPTWANSTSLYTFLNGLTLTGDTVRLGGALTQNTTIPYNTFNLTFGQAGNSGTTSFETGVNLGSGTNTTVPLSTRGTSGNNGQVLISRGTGNSPEYVDTLNNFVLNSSTFNNSTLNNTTLNNNTTVNGPTVFNNNVTVNDTAEFNNKVIFNQLPELPLPKGNIWVGNENDIADSVAPGANGTVLRIVNGIPTWTNSSSLYTFQNGLTLTGDTVRFGGALTQNTTLGLGINNLTIGNSGQSGTTTFETGVNLGSGTNTTVSLSTRGTAGNNGQVLISRGTGNSPEYVDTLNNFVLNSSTFNNSTLNNTTLNNTTTVNGPAVFNNTVNHNDNVTFGDTAIFNSKVIFNQLPQLPLPKGNIWVGDSTGYADSVAPGANGTVLRIVNGIPTWTNSTSLYTFQNGLTLTGDTVRLGGALTQNTTIPYNTFNLTFGQAGNSGTTGFETGVNLGSGTNTTVPLSTRGTAGNNGQVLISRGAGNSPEYVDTLNNFVLNSSTFNNSTLNNTTLNNTTTVNGPAVFNNTVNLNDNVTFGDTAIFNSKVIFNQLPQLPLPKGNIWVGDSTGYADSVAPGANGTVLRIVNGIPTWTNSTSLYTFLNGLTLTGDTVRLGGALTQNTTIPYNTFNLTFGQAGNTGTTGFETGVNLGSGTNTTVPLSTRGTSGNNGQVLISRGTGNSPEYVDTLNNFVLNSSTFNNSTLNNNTTVNGPAIFNNTVNHNDNVTFGDTAIFNSKVIFNQLPQLPLPKGNIWVGDTTGYADSVAPGANGTVLRIVNGIPTWTNSTSLYTFQNGLTLTGDTVRLGGALTQNTTIPYNTFNLTFGQAGNTGTTGFETGVNLGSGTNTTVPLSTRGTSGNNGQVLISRGAGNSPEYVDTLNNFVLNSSTFNNSTLNNTTLNNSTTVNGPAVFNNTVNHNDNVTFGDTAIFNSKVIFNQLPQLPLPKGNIWVGDSTGYADSVAPGANGTVLRIVNGIPTWTNSTSLYTFQNGLTLTGDTVRLGGALTQNTTIPYNTFNLTFGQAGNTGTTGFETGVNLGSGTNTTVPLSTRGTSGNNGQVLISRGTGNSPEYVDTLNNFVLNSSTFNNSTLNNTTLNNSTTVNGPAVFNNTVNHNDNVTFGDTAIFNSKVIFNQLPQLPLPKGNIWVGDSTGYADSVAPGANGTVLRIVNGIPTWTNSTSLYTFQNGLTLTGDTVRLGGALTQNTTIPYNTFNLTFGQAGNTGTTGFETGVNLGSGTNTTVPLSTRGTAGNIGQVLISRGTGNSPEYVDTLNNFVLNSSTFNNSTLNNTTLNNNTTVNGTITFNNTSNFNDNVTFGDTTIHNGPSFFNNTVVFNQLPKLPLPKGNIWVGDTTGYADSVAPGANGTVLRIVNGIPTWVSGTGLYSFHNGITLSNDSVTLGGNFIKNTSLGLGIYNLNIGTAGQSGTTIFETGVNLGSGTNTTVPLSTRGTAGNNGQVLISRGTGNSPEYVDTLNNFVLNSSTFNNSTLNNTTTVNGTITFNNTANFTDNVTFGDTTIHNGPSIFNNTVVFNQLPKLPLPKGNIWVGDTTGYADSVAPGANGTVLRIVNGIPTWTNSTGLYTFQNGLTLTGDTVRLGGALTQNTTIPYNTFNLTFGQAGNSGTTGFETGVNLGSGTNTTVPLSTRGTSGNNGQVLISRGTGNSPEYVDTLNNFVLNSSTFNNSTLNNTTLNNTTTVNGPAVFNNTVNYNDNVTFGDTAIFNSKVIFNQLPQLPLPKGNIWVGDSTGYADSVAPGANGTVLRIVNGIPTWTNSTSLYTFQNGLTLTGDTVRLGGALTQNTTIPYNTFNLTFGQAGNSGTTGFETGVNLGSGTNTTVPLSTRGTSGNTGQVLISRGTGNSPEYVDTLNNFVLNSSTFNNSTLNNTTLNNTTTVNGQTTFNDNVTFGDTTTHNGPSFFNNTVVFNQLPKLPLPKGNIWVGDTTGYADSVAPGANGTVLRIVNGIPTWVSGTGLYSFHNGITLSNDSVTLGGNFIKNTSLGLGIYNLNVGTAGQSGTTTFETGVNLGSGTNTTVPLSTRGTAGNNGQVLISRGTGNSPEYVDTLNNFVLNSSTFNNSTLNNTTLNNTTTVNGAITFNNTANFTDNVTFGDTTIHNGPSFFNNTVVFNQLPKLPLPKGNIWVGDTTGYADSVAPGANGTVLRIVNGIPTWVSGTGIYSFHNGLTLSNDSVTFGGNLIKNTSLGLGAYNLTIGNSGQTGETTFETGVNLGSSVLTNVPLNTRGSDGTTDQILIGMGAGNSPRWVDTLANKYLKDFTLTGSNTTFNSTTVTYNNGTTTTFNGNTFFNSPVTVNANATFNNPVNFDSTVTFAKTPIFPLKKGQLIYGDTNNIADTLSPGANNTVLKIQNGLPTWVPSTGLYNFQNGLTLSGDTVRFGGTLNSNTTLNIANNNLTIGTAANSGNVIFGTGLNLGSASDTTASLNTRGSDGTFGNVMISRGAGNSPMWTSTLSSLTISNSTVNSTTINNSTTNNLTMTGNTTVNGPTVFNSTVNTTDKVTFGDTAQFNSVAIFNQLPQLPLQQNAIFVGNATNLAAPYNSTNQPGHVLTQDNTGKPVWKSLDSLTEDWKVGGNSNPSSPVFGNKNATGGLNIVAGNQNRINISGTSANVTLPGNGVTPTSLTFNNTANTFGTSISAAAGQGANINYTLPPTQGNSGSILQNDGSGNLTWYNPSPGATFVSVYKGKINLTAGAKTVTVSGGMPALTQGSVITVTFETSGTPCTITAYVSGITDGTSFVVQFSGAVPAGARLSYIVIP